jgi:hypothetical protein
VVVNVSTQMEYFAFAMVSIAVLFSACYLVSQLSMFWKVGQKSVLCTISCASEILGNKSPCSKT